MIKIFCAFFLFASANGFYIENNLNKSRILGGNEIDITVVPYLVQILEDGGQICGGSIISKQWILTAAHCIEDDVELTVLTGAKLKNHGGQEYGVENVVVHEGFDYDFTGNDIALIKLSTPIKFDRTQNSIGISTTPAQPGQKVMISGFGKIEGNRYNRLAKTATVTVMQYGSCVQRWKDEVELVPVNTFCAGDGLPDACSGDSGGPAVINGELAGIVSFGKQCDENDDHSPSFYTEVYKYRDWIKENTGLQL